MKLPLLALDEVCLKITDGTHHSPPIAASGIPYVTAKHVKPEGLIFFEDPWYVSEADHSAIYSRCDPKKGDVLYIKDGATTGIAALNTYDFPFSMLSSVALLRPKPELCDSRFLCWWLNSPISKEKFIGQMGGAAIKRLTLAKIKRFEIPLPPLAEQRRIAEVLDKAEALRAKRRDALAQLDSLTQSLFLDLFGDPATNTKGWPCFAFAELGENQDSQRVPVKSSERDGRQGNYPYYGASGIIDWVDSFIYDGDRLLIGEDGANLIARATPVAFIARGKYWVNNHAHVIAENGRADLRYLEFFIEQLDLNPFISGTAQPKLNRSNLDRIPVPLPPLDLQREFARRIAAVEKLKTAQRTALAELDSLFASLQHRAFRGEL